MYEWAKHRLILCHLRMSIYDYWNEITCSIAICNRFSRFSHVNANFLRFHCLAVNYDDIFTSIGSVSSNRYYNGSSMECVLTIVIYSSEKFGCHFICQILSSTIMRSIITFYMDVNICAVISFHSPLGIPMY